MTALPSVAVGLPFSDQPSAQFALAVKSVFAQTLPHWQLLLLADGASPENLDAARAISDTRVDLVIHNERRGLATRLNELAWRADTPVLFRMDADDAMHPERLALQVEALAAAAAPDVVGCRSYLMDGADCVRGGFQERFDMPSSARGYLRSNAFTHPTVAGWTEWFRENPYDETLLRSQDKALWLATFRHSRFQKMRDRLLYYRVTEPLSARRQAQSSHYDRVVLRRYGANAGTRLEVAASIAKSHAKQVAFRALVRKQASSLYERKLDVLQPQEWASAREGMQSISAAQVPGW